MNYKEELIRVFNECITEIFDGEELSEQDKLDIDLLKESATAKLLNDNLSDKDQEFVIQNLDLYKRMFKAIFTSDETELKKVALAMLKTRNERDMS